MKQTLNILHIEDSKEDSELIQRMLSSNGFQCKVTRVESRPAVFDALEKNTYDLILADCKLPRFSGLQALEIAHALKPETPFVFVSGTIGEETAIESLRNGATDYVLKDRLSRLIPAVRRALTEAEERMLCRQLQQRLREAGRLEAISTLSNGIAHDFNNILTIVLGHASLLAMDHKDPDRVLEISGTISEAARRGSEIVQQLLAFARKSDGHVAPADLNRYIEAHLNAFRERLPRGINLTFEPAGALPHILIDAGQLDRILANLVTNSIDAMSGGGRIVLSTRLVSATELPNLLPELASENYVCLTVTDTGKGIDSTTREHVFEPFFTTKERGRGTGLGLPVVYGLMQAHHGYVDVQSEVDKGTMISLFFPVPSTSVANPPPVLHHSDPALNGSETILVVEDETDVSFYLETMLQSHGYRVLCAADVDQALELFKEHQNEIQLVFSDIGLPRVDGIALCEKLRKLKPGIPLILASGYPTKEFKTRINDLGAQAFLSKPYNTHDILQTVRKTLDGSKVLHLSS
ncbi:MAG TPA: response regulator [Candidatus Methylacidiphilales bacterium]|jgi:signal transduction histidine kinase|nr:response regulator [Candidatus Methylacidiphilales bacterium]